MQRNAPAPKPTLRQPVAGQPALQQNSAQAPPQARGGFPPAPLGQQRGGQNPIGAPRGGPAPNQAQNRGGAPPQQTNLAAPLQSPPRVGLAQNRGGAPVQPANQGQRGGQIPNAAPRGGPAPNQTQNRGGAQPIIQQRNSAQQGAAQNRGGGGQRWSEASQQPFVLKTDREFNAPAPNQIYPISSLNTWNQRWTIKARISYKSALKPYHTDKSTGSLFTVNFIDQSGEISCTLFNELAQNYYDVFQVGKVFYISKGKIKDAGKWNPVDSEFELTLNSQSEVMECTIEDLAIPMVTYKFVTLASLLDMADNKIVDILCVLQGVSELTPVTSKAGKELVKRELTIVDNSGEDPSVAVSALVVLWNETAQTFDLSPNTIVALKNARVSRVNGGVQLSFIQTTKMGYAQGFGADDPAGSDQWQTLREWFENLPVGSPTICITQPFQSSPAGADVLLSLKEGREQAIGKDKPFYFSIRGTIMMIKHDDTAQLFYTSCPNEGCRKKVIFNEQSQHWECLKCEAAFPQMLPRYILSMVVADHSGSQWMGCFDEAGQVILGADATTVWNLRASKDEAGLNETFQRATYRTHRLTIKAFEEQYQDEMKLKCTIVGVDGINFLTGSRDLVEMILQLQQPAQ